MSSSQTFYLSEYQRPDFTVHSTQLLFKLGLVTTVVIGELQIERLDSAQKILWLDGEDLTLHTVYVDGELVPDSSLITRPGKLGIPCDQSRALVKIEVVISPESNLSLSGLYVSGKSLCTQCEAQGFRRIMYSLDRPDVFSTYDVALIYDVNQFPVVVAAGHCQERKSLSHGYAYVRFVDLTPKPTYLFALIAGYFHTLESSLTTCHDQSVQLFIHLPVHYSLSQVDFAMDALKKSMVWDERVFNCAYDLDAYHIAGFPDFNFGAMENKGLNIFNTSTLLADPNITTDAGYLRVLSVVGHEYFHNWTGNRVGCENWFQLSLKEGLTTYREMRFACDIYGPTARLDYIQSLVEGQFREDAGPTAHPVIPDSYQKIDNFYTDTIYTKGSEILRMLEDIIGRESIDEGIKRYLTRYDGQAVSMDAFLSTISEMTSCDLSDFFRWYKQIGTPLVRIQSDYQIHNQSLILTITQTASSSDRRSSYQPLIIPIKARLWSQDGAVIMPEKNQACELADDGTWVTVVRETKTELVLHGISEKPLLSAFIGLSAPVNHDEGLSADEYAKLLAFETDPYVQMHSAKQCWLSALHQDSELLSDSLRQSLKTVLSNWQQAPDLVPLVFNLPSLQVAMESRRSFVLDDLMPRRKQLLDLLATSWEQEWLEMFQGVSYRLRGEYAWRREDVEMRGLQGLSLSMLLQADYDQYRHLASRLFDQSDNVTTRGHVLKAVLAHQHDLGSQLLNCFVEDVDGHDLLINQWLFYSAARKQKDLTPIVALLEDARFDLKQPNRVSSWCRGWLSGNYDLFHQLNGEGYAVMADLITKVDAINPFTSSRLIGPLIHWQYFDVPRQKLMRQKLTKIFDQGCSSTLREKIVVAL